MITTTELLNFLCKVQKLSPYAYHTGVSVFQTDEGYKITLQLDWDGDNNFYHQTVFITNENESTWDNGEDYDFYTMNDILDEMLELQKQKEIKQQEQNK